MYLPEYQTLVKQFKSQINYITHDQLSNTQKETPSFSSALAAMQSHLPFFKWAQKQFSLNSVHCNILLCTMLLTEQVCLKKPAKQLGKLNHGQLASFYACLLSVTTDKINQALSATSPLFKNQLIKVKDSTVSLNTKIKLSQWVEHHASAIHFDPQSLINDYFEQVKVQSQINTSRSYRHDMKYLNYLLTSSQKSHHILLCGPDSKTLTDMLSKLCQSTQKSAFVNKSVDRFGDPVLAKDQLMRSLAARCALNNQSSFMVFDYSEQLIQTDATMLAEGLTQAWYQHIFANSPISTVWLCVDDCNIPPHLLSQFDYCLKLKPASSNEKRIALTAFFEQEEDLAWCEQVANTPAISLTDIEQGAALIQQANITSKQYKKHFFSRLAQVKGTQLAKQPHVFMGKKEPSLPAFCNEQFNPDMSQTDMPLINVQHIAAQAQEGRFLFEGIPGTGKTAFVQYLAHTLNKPLIKRSAADILGMYVGQSEKAIKRMFEQAAQADAILLLDEAETFLSDRKAHSTAWQTSQVNEMLVQMEQFKGLFFACTNLAKKIDTAIQRRFDFTVHFDYINFEQRIALSKQTLSQVISTETEQALRLTQHITPADFSLYLRQQRLIQQQPCESSLACFLQQQNQSRQPLKNPIGFI